MGFDAFGSIGTTMFPLSIVRLAGDAVANAIEREFLERDRAKLTVRLERARRMQMVGLLAAGLHKLQQHHRRYSRLFGNGRATVPAEPNRRAMSRRYAARPTRGRDLVDNILTFGRRTDARVRLVQVRTLLQEAASLLRVTLPSGCRAGP